MSTFNRARLKELREAKNLSVNELGNRAGVNPSHVLYIESGKKPRPSFEVVAKLAAALDVSTDEFLAK